MLHLETANKRCRYRNFDLKKERQGRPLTQLNNADLKVMVEADPNKNIKELAV